MCKVPDGEDYFSDEAIAERRKDEPPEVTNAWKHARDAGGFRSHKVSKHWDGKPKKYTQPF